MADANSTLDSRPRARTEDLLVVEVGDEAVIYDQDAKVAHALSPLAAAVFAHADGERSLAEIAERSAQRLSEPVTEAQVDQAVGELSALGLLETYEPTTGGLTRRDSLKVLGAVGAGAMLVSSVTAPFAMAAGVADNYLCGTGSSDIQNLSHTDLYPQVWASVGSIDYSGGKNSYTGTWTLAGTGAVGGPLDATNSNAYDLGQPCFIAAPTGHCTYQSNKIPTSEISNQAQCNTYGFYWNASSNTWEANAPDTAGTTGVAGNTGAALCVSNGERFYNVDEGQCNHLNYICANSANVWDGIAGPGDNGQAPPVCKPGDRAVLIGDSHPTTYQWYAGSWSGGGGTQGVYQCLPCDGNVVGNSYQCCEVVCAPTTAGGVVSPAGWSPSTTQATGPGTYTQSACQIWGGGFCSYYAAKWCTSNPCNLAGDCKS